LTKIELKKILTGMVAKVLPIVSGHFFQGRGAIVLLHRILPEKEFGGPRLGWSHKLETSIEEQERRIRWFLDKGYHPIAISEIPTWLASSSSEKFIVFTVDDGYVDAYQHTWPLFKKYRIPWTFFVATDYMERKVVMWWYLLERYFLEKSGKCVMTLPTGEEKTFQLGSHQERENAFLEVESSILASDHRVIERWCFEQWGEKTVRSLTDELCCTWDQILELSRDPDITIGSHTVHHVRLTKVSDSALQQELIESKRILEERLGKPVEHLSYPLGSARVREFEMAREANYLSAVTVEPKNVLSRYRDHLHSLPRLWWDKGDDSGFFNAVTGSEGFLRDLSRMLRSITSSF
jgi:peptidoglycan/xylan/chitin deacetylase (PgdA/CDA1 family)